MNTKRIGLILGPALFLATRLFFRPEGLSEEANAILGSTLWIAAWWILEVVPIAVTALLPILLFPLTGGLPIKETTACFGHQYIFLYIGGFMLAIAIEKWNLHRRMALTIIHLIGSNVKSIILGFMVATGFLSMWISNTATAVLMYPIGMAIVAQLQDNPNTREDENLIFGKPSCWRLRTAHPSAAWRRWWAALPTWSLPVWSKTSIRWRLPSTIGSFWASGICCSVTLMLEIPDHDRFPLHPEVFPGRKGGDRQTAKGFGADFF